MMVSGAAAAHGIPLPIALALTGQESGFDPSAVSPKGAMGLTQLMPDTARDMGVTDPHDPQQNLDGGFKYLAQQYAKYGNWTEALAAYNAGPGAVDQYGGVPPYTETQDYVRRILAHANAMATSAAPPVPAPPRPRPRPAPPRPPIPPQPRPTPRPPMVNPSAAQPSGIEGLLQGLFAQKPASNGKYW